MTHDMDALQWFLFLTANWLTALAYTFIPVQAVMERSKSRAAARLDQYLVEAFIFLCGLHHWFHPIAMRYGLWWPNIGLDMTMAGVSIAAVYKRWEHSRGAD